MRLLSAVLLLGFSMLHAEPDEVRVEDPGFVDLFNGKDL
jgi:hypothetical protein